MQRSGVKYESCSWLEEAMLKVHRLRRLERLKSRAPASWFRLNLAYSHTVLRGATLTEVQK